MVKIVNGPAPKVARKPNRSRYPWTTLAVGKHFVVEAYEANAPSIRSCASYMRGKLGRTFAVSEQPDGSVTVERTV